MRTLSSEPPRPRSSRTIPAYPRTLGFALLAMLGACGGAVNDDRGTATDRVPADDPDADPTAPPVTPPSTIDGGQGGYGGDPTFGGGAPAPYDAAPPPPPPDAGATIDAAPDAEASPAGDVASPFDAGTACEAGPKLP